MTNLSAHFTRILSDLRSIVAAVAHRSRPAHQALLVLAYGRISRTITRFNRLYTRWQTNTLPKPRATRASRPRIRPTPEIRLPHRRAWLRSWLNTPSTNLFASRMETLLAMPDMAEFRAAVPRADRLLRPLTHLFGIDLPAAPGTPPPPPRPPAQPSRAQKRTAPEIPRPLFQDIKLQGPYALWPVPGWYPGPS